MIALKDSSLAQIFTLLAISVFFQALLILGKPFSEPIDNWLSLFTEIMVSLYLYILLCLTDFQGYNLLRD
jgi:hypothetical protein